MGLDSSRKAIATEAWSQLVQSIISDNPPSDMGKEYYHTFPEVGSDALQKQLKRLEIYTYKLGTESIQSRLRSSIHSQVPRPNEHRHRPGIKSVRGSISSSKDYENEDANEQDIEHIRGCIRSNKDSAVVQAHEDENEQDIEHIRGCIRSNKDSVLVQVAEDEALYGIEHVQSCIRSNRQFEQEVDYQQEIEHIRGCIRSNKHSEVVQEYEDENWHGIEHIRDCIRSNKYFEPMQDNEKGFNRVRDDAISAMFSMPADYENHPIINYSESLRSTGLPKGLFELENAYQHLLSYGQAKKLSLLFDELLELVEGKHLHGEEKLTLRIQVLKVVKLLHHYGIDTIRTGVEEELEDMNHQYDDVMKNLALLYRKKGLEVMLRICDAEACQRTISEIIGKAERDQVLYKW